MACRGLQAARVHVFTLYPAKGENSSGERSIRSKIRAKRLQEKRRSSQKQQILLTIGQRKEECVIAWFNKRVNRTTLRGSQSVHGRASGFPVCLFAVLTPLVKMSSASVSREIKATRSFLPQGHLCRDFVSCIQRDGSSSSDITDTSSAEAACVCSRTAEQRRGGAVRQEVKEQLHGSH